MATEPFGRQQLRLRLVARTDRHNLAVQGAEQRRGWFRVARDHYAYVEHTGNIYKEAVENALVMSAGYVKTTWDERKGPPKQDPITGGPLIDFARGTLLPAGDIDWSAPFFFDVAYNYHQKDWKKQRYVIVREIENRWELAAKYPEFNDEIIGYEPDKNHQPDYGQPRLLRHSVRQRAFR